jgi:hypothetical protein
MAKAKDELQELQEIGALRFPEQYRGTRGPSTEQLGTTAKQAGLLGLGFAPGAGMADYFGQFPAMEGGTEPSAVENWRQGNYGTSALQGLGAMGDLMYAVPVLGATVGSAMKGPRAAQRMLKELPTGPKISEEGFYSQVEKAILDNPQQKGTGDQFLAQIQKTPGVKPEEIQYTGLDAFLAGRPSVTKAEIQDYLDTNRVQLQEVTLGQYKNKSVSEMTDRELASFYQQTMDMNVAEEYGSNWRQFRRDIEAELTNPELETQAPAGFAKFSTYTIPGGKNYREVLLTMPLKPQTTDLPSTYRIIDEAEEARRSGLAIPAEDIGPFTFQGPNISSRAFQTREEALAAAREDAELERTLGIGESINANFRTIHFDQPNILAHMRLNDRTVDGKPTLFVEEIQSDWHQTGRKSGYTTQESKQAETAFRAYANELAKKYDIPEGQNIAMYGNMRNLSPEEIASYEKLQQSFIDTQGAVPDAPFKTSWHELTLKKALNEAATKGYNQIAFTMGKTQADRYDLSKQVDRISYFKKPNGQYHVVAKDKKTGQDVELGTNNSLDDLEGKIGKSLTEKISRGEGNFSGGDFTDLTGVDLQVGGEGMEGFYDTILPKSLDKIGKKYGTKVRKTTMDTPDGPVEVWAMDIPPEMRETISSQGQPLFQIGAGAAGLGTAGILSLTPGEAEAASEEP